MKKVRLSRAKISLITCLVMLIAACSGGDKQLSKTDVQLAAGDLRTFAASAQMLVEQCTAERATETFCKQQAELLSTKVEDSLKELNGQAGPAEDERKQLSDVASRLHDIVLRADQLSSTPTDAADAGRLAAIAKRLEDALKK